MQFRKMEYTVRDLVDAWTDRSLMINPEYQRGAEWGASQKQGFIDSILRDYPVSPLFLNEIPSKGLGAQISTRYEIVDASSAYEHSPNI
jgi:uncharacterized protein with ParB-like and HNH nuclease domain